MPPLLPRNVPHRSQPTQYHLHNRLLPRKGKVLYRNMLIGVTVPKNTDGRRSSCFDTDHQCFIGKKAFRYLSEITKTFTQTAGYKFRHPEMKRRSQQNREYKRKKADRRSFFLFTKSFIRCAGAVCFMPPFNQQTSSSRS